ncbi:hypothetical protein AAVH_32229, partial [Aphelenchoides avenae]
LFAFLLLTRRGFWLLQRFLCRFLHDFLLFLRFQRLLLRWWLHTWDDHGLQNRCLASLVQYFRLAQRVVRQSQVLVQDALRSL